MNSSIEKTASIPQINEAKSSKLTHLKARRQRWLSVHRWLGLALGLMLSVYGFTGSVLVFHAEIDEWLHRNMLRVESPALAASYRPLEEIFSAGQKAMPPGALCQFATYPRNQNAAFKLRFGVSQASGVMETWLVAINPYTAQVTGKMLLDRSDSVLPNTFIDFIFKLHYALMIPSHEVSTVVVGLSGALLIISTLTGLIVWWPLGGKWRQALLFKPNSGKVRLNYDLHKISGFSTALVMIPVLFSGIYMVLPHNVAPVLELFSPVTYRYWFQSRRANADAYPIGMAKAVAIARGLYPEGRPHWIYGASKPEQTYMVCLDGVDTPGSLLQRRCLVMDRHTGEILDVDDPGLETATAGEILTHWQWPLHSGQAFGMAGRISVFITGLACPLLFLTGVIRWLQKRKANAVKKKRLHVN